MSNAPISNGSNGGRDERGRFVNGNPGGPGNPRARTARQLRDRLDHALFVVCAPDRLISAIDAVLKSAEAGDVAALKLLIERIAGTAVPSDILDTIAELEERIKQPTTEKAT